LFIDNRQIQVKVKFRRSDYPGEYHDNWRMNNEDER